MMGHYEMNNDSGFFYDIVITSCNFYDLIHIINPFLVSFAKFQRATISFVMFACPSLQMHGTTWLPLDGFS
jgi:hypothetical protein